MLINHKFLKEQLPDVKLKCILFLIFIKGIRVNWHSINKYAVLKIHFSGIKEGRVSIRIVKYKAYVINNLKAKMLIGTNIITLKGIDTKLL